MLHRMLRLVLLAMVLAGCGQVAAPGAGSSSAATAVATEELTPVFAFTEAVVGPSRIALGLVRANTPINDPGAKVHLRFFNLDEGSQQPRAEADAVYYGAGLPAAVYVAYPTFDKAGNWGVEIQTRLSGQARPSVSRLQLQVKPKSSVPNIGDPAIPVKTLTVRDVPDARQLSSGSSVEPALYQVSLDEALRSGKPTALLFATPGFCATAVCGPSVQVFQELQKTYGDKVNVIHVEVYKYPFDQSVQHLHEATTGNHPLSGEELQASFSAPMIAWRLQSEPWLFLIDSQGTIVGRYEGGITKEEIGPAIERLIAGQPVTG